MKKYIYFLLTIILVSLVLIVIIPKPKYDESKIDNRLKLLIEPFQSVWATTYLDGGSISIRIIDKNNKKLEIFIPSYLDSVNNYKKIYIGKAYINQDEIKNYKEINNFDDNRLFIVDILGRYPDCCKIPDIKFRLSRRFIDLLDLLLYVISNPPPYST